ncbi:hypothetical protein ACFVGM_08750 [Kitasatospora purpeofusca]|uniref:hypothetical protein n=1 Tax=Kitasatospora purpeofusca TaxID=67352 RepID=UPI0036C3342E
MTARQPYDAYPGTHRPIGTAHVVPDLAAGYNGWDENPHYKRVDGFMREFFGTGHLSAALERSPKTLYKWEDSGYLPPATFILNGASKNGRRRLYTRIQIEGLIAIARDTGILSGNVRFIGQTTFPSRSAELFRVTHSTLPEPITEWS